MSMFSSMSTFVQQAFNTATASVDSIEKTLDIANNYIDNNHKRITKTVKQDAILSTAKHHTAIALELDADANLKKQFNELLTDW